MMLSILSFQLSSRAFGLLSLLKYMPRIFINPPLGSQEMPLVISGGSLPIIIASVFNRFSLSPLNSANFSTSCRALCTSSSSCNNNVVSSAYIPNLMTTSPYAQGMLTPLISGACLILWASNSVANTNAKGEKGQPCRIPVSTGKNCDNHPQWLMQISVSFIKILIHWRNSGPNPARLKYSTKNILSIVSKALE